MSLVTPVLLLSSFVVLAVSLVATVFAGLLRRMVYYEPNCRPCHFNSHPFRFTVCISIELAAALICVLGAVKAMRMILERL